MPFIDVVARGGMFLAAIQFHSQDVSWIFAHLVSGAEITPVMEVLRIAGQIHTALVAVSLYYHAKRCHKLGHALIIIEELTLMVMFYVLQPLMSFVMYYNIFHSARHVWRLSKLPVVRGQLSDMSVVRKKGVMSAGLTIFTVLALLGTFGFDTWRIGAQITPHSNAEKTALLGSCLRAVFIAMSTFTTPHMIVVSLVLKSSPRVVSGSEPLRGV